VKTTVEIADGLLADAKTFAKEHDLTLRELLECGLRKELRDRKKPATAVKWRHEPYGDANASTWVKEPFDENDWRPIREASYERDEGE
jgi:hypothetical protein